MATERSAKNLGLTAAKKAKNDEFYTQYYDIQEEVEAYFDYDPDTFRGKTVYCNCDDPFESNFFKYFAVNFNRLGLRKLITTSYDGSSIAGNQISFEEYMAGNGTREKPRATCLEIEKVKDLNADGVIGIEDAKMFLVNNPHSHRPLEGGGDFRSEECIELLKEADIVVTNPPFSLFRDYIALLREHKKKFLVIGNTNAITYKEVFPLIKANSLWLGCTNFNVGMHFEVPDNRENYHYIDEGTGKKMVRVSTSCWYTNLEHGRRRQKLNLMPMADNLRYTGVSSYDKYDNFDAIEVGTYKGIPSDYSGMMGVPITFLDKFNPDQFEILGYEKSAGLRTKVYPKQIQIDKSGKPKQSAVTKLNDGAAIKLDYPPENETYYVVNGEFFVQKYTRIFIRHLGPTSTGAVQ
ncbi:adenine-specific methyltransferase EcoRI family protein [Roseibium sp.]|uniref:adenine-specific methyltransferase EcoRI family protein n=1 Tax=Roseibium sp. TaxID=1936156 RepID=UPI003B50C7C8